MARKSLHPFNPIVPALAATTRLLGDLLGDCVEALTEALAEIESGKSQAAMSRIASLDMRLADAMALHRAIVVMHSER